jgi:hypothetical protein
METKSSGVRVLWSLAYLALAVVVLRFPIGARMFLVGASSPQNRKVVEEAFSSNPQVRVSKLKVGINERRFKEEFDESDDWPKRLDFEIESIAVKPIVYLQVNLNFPETKSSGNLMSYPIRFGIRPDFPDPSSKSLRLMPGEKFEFAVEPHYQQLERFLRKRHLMSELHQAEVEIGFIIFEDGTGWTAGDFLRPDPNNPKRYINVGRSVPN